MNTKEHYLITGGAGFLLDKGHEVISLDKEDF
jgi:hypothetical protein